MYRGNKVALVIPAHNEEKLLPPTLGAVPELIDQVFVIDDCSTDRTAEFIRTYSATDPRVIPIQNEQKMGPGSGIIAGYIAAREGDFNLVVVVGGDNQMPLDEVERFLDPILDDGIDYTEGNRFIQGGNAFEDMPAVRLFGNSLISFMTKITSGYYKYWDVVDGYTAISKRALHLVPWEKAWKRYGYLMDFLIRLNTYGCRVRDIPRTAIYLPGERQSQIKGVCYALSVSLMIMGGVFRRLFVKYFLRDFHPVIFFYLLGLILIPLGVWLGIKIIAIKMLVEGGGVTALRGILCALFLILGVQTVLFTMFFDMQESQ